jgi:putative nucleotidyltransferase with HDIG domain
MQTIEVMALTIEKRDPYTAGHQKQVAQIATAIAHKMQLPDHQIDGINLGGLVHDIGKVYVPAEILNRPGRLTDEEMALIRAHPAVGHDIVKGVEFGWPVADMVLQHHERVNGSGYPNGLMGDQIILEARILAVADVIEAMAAHRPYRPALGIEQALREIETNRGNLYDPQVVDAALHLFREDDYIIEDTFNSDA